MLRSRSRMGMMVQQDGYASDSDPEALTTILDRIESYYTALTPREQAVMRYFLFCAMDPPDRMRWRAIPVLTDREEATLRDLEKEASEQ